MQGNNSQLIIFLIVMAFSALSWVIGYLKEQSRIKKAKDEQKRRFEESLRTGRPVDEPVRAKDPAADLAARRQAQLQELRRQQVEERARAQGGVVVVRGPSPGNSGGAGIPGTLGVPGPQQPQRPARGQVVIQRGPNAGAQRTQRRDPQQPPVRAKETQPPTFASGNEPAMLQARRLREQSEREAAAQMASRIEARDAERRAAELAAQDRDRRLAAASSRAASAAKPLGGARGLIFDKSGAATSESLRRAIVLAEVFGRPVSDR
jgi:hypothetical protein